MSTMCRLLRPALGRCRDKRHTTGQSTLIMGAMQLTDAVVLVTGAAAGIGQAAAARFAAKGAQVLVPGHDPDRTGDVARDVGGTALFADLAITRRRGRVFRNQGRSRRIRRKSTGRDRRIRVNVSVVVPGVVDTGFFDIRGRPSPQHPRVWRTRSCERFPGLVSLSWSDRPRSGSRYASSRCPAIAVSARPGDSDGSTPARTDANRP